MANIDWRKSRKFKGKENKYEQYLKLKGAMPPLSRDSLERRAQEAEREWREKRGLTKFLRKRRKP
jgi:hypothetical protein